jgi:hypothetical protein
MVRRLMTLGLLFGALTATGCLHTRYAESSSLLHIHAGDCPCRAHDSTYRERRWSGLWFGQPDGARP